MDNENSYLLLVSEREYLLLQKIAKTLDLPVDDALKRMIQFIYLTHVDTEREF